MRYHQLDLNLLVALDSLLAERNITLAGRRLNLSQSAMSSSLARLRDFFGDELLVLVGRKMVPTPLGESLSGPVRRILVEIRSTIEATPAFDPATATRRFALMMSDYVATVLMTPVLRHLAKLAPGVSFEILPNNVPAPLDYLERAEIDFLVMPEDTLGDVHPRMRLFEDDYVCVVAAENPAIGTSLSLEQYLQLGHVVLQFARGRAPAVDDWLGTHLAQPRRIEVVAMNFNLLPQFIIGTPRIATIQRRIARYYEKFGALKLVETPMPIPSMVESVQWHSAFDRDPANRWLREVLRTMAQDAGVF